MSFGAVRHTVTSHALTSFHFPLHLVATTHTSYQHRLVQNGEESKMFNVSLSDRLKAAVNTLEQTGSSLQARAIGQAQPGQGPQSPSQVTTSLARSVSPSKATVTSPTQIATGNTTTEPNRDLATSPTRTYSTSQLAENALSGLRKSFNFHRDGPGHIRTASSSSPIAGNSSNVGQQELKDITSPLQNAAASSSRPSSPAPISARLGTLVGGSNFALGSDTPSVNGTANGTPRPRSPNPLGGRSPRLKSLPRPNPDDPASYPLPPSPVVGPSQLLSPAPASAFADPLGASPSISPLVPPDPPTLGLQSPTPDVEKTQAEAESSKQDVDGATGRKETTEAEPTAEPAEMNNEVVKKVEEAAQRYEGESRVHL
jgi:hypothetical protein